MKRLTFSYRTRRLSAECRRQRRRERHLAPPPAEYLHTAHPSLLWISTFHCIASITESDQRSQTSHMLLPWIVQKNFSIWQKKLVIKMSYWALLGLCEWAFLSTEKTSLAVSTNSGFYRQAKTLDLLQRSGLSHIFAWLAPKSRWFHHQSLANGNTSGLQQE